jgi:hypothetical protein
MRAHYRPGVWLVLREREACNVNAMSAENKRRAIPHTTRDLVLREAGYFCANPWLTRQGRATSGQLPDAR